MHDCKVSSSAQSFLFFFFQLVCGMNECKTCWEGGREETHCLVLSAAESSLWVQRPRMELSHETRTGRNSTWESKDGREGAEKYLGDI